MKKQVAKAQKRSDVLVPEVREGGTYARLVDAISSLLHEARTQIAQHINTTLVRTYWQTGRYIVEYEQHGRDRAKYGEGLVDRLVRDLTAREGKGYSKTNILYMRKLYLTFRKGETLSHFLSWSHYMLILKKTEGIEIEFYCRECEASHWTVRELRRQIDSSLFERLALSKDKKGVLALAHRGNEVQRAEDVLRDPYVLEFSGLPPNKRYTELKLHDALLAHMKDFLLELGKGFSFVKSQYAIPINTKNPCHVVLVFFNYRLNCFVLIDLKRNGVEHYDIGQMNMYLNYFKEEVNEPGHAEPIGIVLGADKDDVMVHYATRGITNKLFVSRYQLFLPDKESLRRELTYAIEAETGKVASARTEYGKVKR